MKISDLLKNPTIRLMMFLFEKKEARYSEMLKWVGGRGTLTLAIRELEKDGLIRRRIEGDSRPAKAYYSLTDKGMRIAESLAKAKEFLKIS